MTNSIIQTYSQLCMYTEIKTSYQNDLNDINRCMLLLETFEIEPLTFYAIFYDFSPFFHDF